MLNTDLKISARVLANRLCTVAGDLIEPEHNIAVKGRSIQNNLHLVRKIIERIKDDTKAVLINLDQSKAFDRVDHQFLVTFLETVEFEPEFRRWASILNNNSMAVVQVNGKRLRSFVIERLTRQGYSLSPLLYVFALEPLFQRLRDGGVELGLHCVPFADCLTARVCLYVDDITVFMSHLLDIVVVKEVVAEYKEKTGTNINFDKSKGLRMGS